MVLDTSWARWVWDMAKKPVVFYCLLCASFNAAHGANTERQAFCREILVEDLTVRNALGRHGIVNPDLGDILDVLIRELGIPRTLKALNIGRDQLDLLAENSLHDIWIRINAVPLTEKLQVLEILETVAG
jgi:hypothetical protein